MFAKLFNMWILPLALLLTACGSGGATDVFEVGIEPAAQVSSETQIRGELGPILQAMFSGSMTDTLSLLEYIPIACANVDALGGPPRCPEGAPEGTILEVFPMLGTEGTFATSEEMVNVLTNSQVKTLHAVYLVTPGPNDEPHFPVGQYAMLFERDINDLPLPLVLRVMDGKIVRMDFHVGISPAEMLQEIPVERIVIPPAQAESWSEEVRGAPAGAP